MRRSLKIKINVDIGLLYSLILRHNLLQNISKSVEFSSPEDHIRSLNSVVCVSNASSLDCPYPLRLEFYSLLALVGNFAEDSTRREHS